MHDFELHIESCFQYLSTITTNAMCVFPASFLSLQLAKVYIFVTAGERRISTSSTT